MQALFVSTVLTTLTAFALLTAYSAFRAPKRFAAQLGFDVVGADGLNEVRAQYGGFYLLVAVIGLLALFHQVSQSAALLVTTVIFGGLILGRITSLMIDGGFKSYRRPVIRALYLIDGIGVVTSATALAASVG